MTIHASSRKLAAALAFLALSISPAHALIKFANAQGDLFVTGAAGVTYDSNLFATSAEQDDTSYNASVELEYKRKAGLIGVNGNLGWYFGFYDRFESEDYADPRGRVELTKDSGRTTGSLLLGAARQSRTEAALNLRTTSWDYDASLNVKYPVIERYTITGLLAYNRRDFTENTTLVDLNTYTASADLFYVYRSDRDLLGGYRYRVTDTSSNTRNYDHAFTLGVSGRILPKLNGTVRGGFQSRRSERSFGATQHFDAVTASASATWIASRRWNVIASASRDFSTLATDVSVESTSLGLDTSYALTAKASLLGGVGLGWLKHLGLPTERRDDTYFTYNAGASYTFSDRLKVSLTYFYYQNWSSRSFSDYDRHSLSLNLTSRW